MDRIEKIRNVETWKIDATQKTKEEKKRGDGQSGYESRDSFEETSDFIQLLSRDPRKFVSEKLPSNQISSFIFQGVSTHRDQALLEVDIALANGTLIQGAQIALSRQEGMRYLSRKPGEEIIADQIVKGTFLTIARPGRELETPDFVREDPSAVPTSPHIGIGTAWNYALGFGAMGVAILLLIYFLAL